METLAETVASLAEQVHWQDNMQKAYIDNLVMQNQRAYDTFQQQMIAMRAGQELNEELNVDSSSTMSAVVRETVKQLNNDFFQAVRLQEPQIIRPLEPPKTYMISGVPVNWGFDGAEGNLRMFGICPVIHFDCLCMPPTVAPNGRGLLFVNIINAEGKRLIQYLEGLTQDVSGRILSPPLEVNVAPKQGLMYYVEEHAADSRFFCNQEPQGVEMLTSSTTHANPTNSDVSVPTQLRSTALEPGRNVDALAVLRRLIEDDVEPQKGSPPSKKLAMPAQSSSVDSRPPGEFYSAVQISLADFIDRNGGVQTASSSSQQWTQLEENDNDKLMHIPEQEGEEEEEEKEEEEEGKESSDTNTSVMIMALPLSLESHGLLKLLWEQHGILGGRDIDYMYLPVDFASRQSKGYALVNFRETSVASQFMIRGGLEIRDGRWEHGVWVAESRWTNCQWAHIQGREANARRFLKKHGHLRNNKMRPMVWLDGSASEAVTLWRQ